MYTILIKDSNELVTTQKERIMKRSKLVDKFHFLMNPKYNDQDMTKFTAILEYILPVSREYKTEILVMSEELYNNKIEYVLPFDTDLTKEAGDIEIQVTFTYVEMDENGEIKQYVRKTSPGKITIVPISAWSDMIPDESLTALDQRLLKTDAMIQQLIEINENIDAEQVNDLQLTDDLLQVSVNGTPKGKGVKIMVPTINDGEIDGTNNGILELDNVEGLESEEPEESEELSNPIFIDLENDLN